MLSCKGLLTLAANLGGGGSYGYVGGSAYCIFAVGVGNSNSNFCFSRADACYLAVAVYSSNSCVIYTVGILEAVLATGGMLVC